MPYKNIHWVKLEIRLLNDPRFFTMCEISQLIYVKLILLCAHFKGKVPRSYPILRQLLRCSYNEATLNKYINEIRANFPKVLSHKDYYYIKGFKEMHNWVLPGNSQGTAREAVDKIREEEDKNKNREILNFFQEMYLKETEINYPISYGRDKKLIYELLGLYDIPTLKDLITEFFVSARGGSTWWADKLSIPIFKVVIPQIIGRLRKK